jgi:MarR family transcriptional regulator, organic hydroperoxide resistance regulator
MNQRLMQAVPPYVLERTLPYLVNRAGVRIAIPFGRDLARHQLTLPAWRVLASVYERSSQTVSGIAAHTSVELSRVSRLAAELGERGLLKRKVSGADARAVQIMLTVAGRALVEEIIPLAQRYETVALAGIDDREVAIVKRVLAKIYENIETLGVGATRTAARRKRSAIDRATPNVRTNTVKGARP